MEKFERLVSKVWDFAMLIAASLIILAILFIAGSLLVCLVIAAYEVLK